MGEGLRKLSCMPMTAKRTRFEICVGHNLKIAVDLMWSKPIFSKQCIPSASSSFMLYQCVARAPSVYFYALLALPTLPHHPVDPINPIHHTFAPSQHPHHPPRRPPKRIPRIHPRHLPRQILRQHNEHIRPHAREDMPPAMQLERKAPRHAERPLRARQLYAREAVHHPQREAEGEAQGAEEGSGL